MKDNEHKSFVEQEQENKSPKMRLRSWLWEPPVEILSSGKNKITTRERCARTCFMVNVHLSFIFMLLASNHLGMGIIFLIVFGYPILLLSALIAPKAFVLLAKYVEVQDPVVKEWVIALIGFSVYQTLLLLAVPLGKCEGCFEPQPFVFNIIISAVISVVLYIVSMAHKDVV